MGTQATARDPAARDQNLPRGAVDAFGPAQDQPRPGETGQPHQVDHHGPAAVMPGDVAGQHARIGRHGVRIDQCQPHAGQRVHAPHPQHQRMGMPAADQHQITGQGKRRHRRTRIGRKSNILGLLLGENTLGVRGEPPAPLRGAVQGSGPGGRWRGGIAQAVARRACPA